MAQTAKVLGAIMDLKCAASTYIPRRSSMIQKEKQPHPPERGVAYVEYSST